MEIYIVNKAISFILKNITSNSTTYSLFLNV